VPLYDFVRLGDGAPVEAVMDFDEVCGIGEFMLIAGQMCRRLPSRQVQACTQRNVRFKAWSLPTEGCTDNVTGYKMPRRGEDGAPHYDKDGVAMFDSREEINKFCDSAARATKGAGRYDYGKC
jgi:hypothetical protein